MNELRIAPLDQQHAIRECCDKCRLEDLYPVTDRDRRFWEIPDALTDWLGTTPYAIHVDLHRASIRALYQCPRCGDRHSVAHWSIDYLAVWVDGDRLAILEDIDDRNPE